MQQQEEQREEGISILDIFKLLLSKIKILIIAVLIGGVLGASFAVWRTIDVNHYGTKVEFYVNPEKARDSTTTDNSQYGVYGAYGKHVMDNMIKLLASESFTEQMMLNGERLPEKDVWADSAEGTATLNEKIDAAAAELVKLNEAQEDLDEALKTHAEKTELLVEKKDILDKDWAALYYLNLVTSTAFNEIEYTQTIAGKAEAIYQNTIQSYQEWKPVRDEVKEIEKNIELQKEAMAPVQDKADEVLEEALDEWRGTEKYRKALEEYNNAVKFSYLQDEENVEDVNDLARSFIYVDIFVLNDVDFAKEVLERVKTVVPTYVENNMTVPSGYVGTNCKRITRTDDIRMTNPGYTTKQAIKYGALVAFAALVVACVAVMVMDKADKRLRDVSVITKQFNVPLLGLIPTIDEIEEEKDVKTSKEAE